jgi:hypothetical protein
VTVSATSGVGTISQGSFTIPCSTALGGQNLSSLLAASTTPGGGFVSITTVSPSGVTTTKNITATVN